MSGTFQIHSDNEKIYYLEHDAVYSLLAAADDHYGFNSWYNDNPTARMIDNENFAVTNLNPTGDLKITPIFSVLNYNFKIESTQGLDSVLSTPESGSFPALSSVEINVVPQVGYKFEYWIDPWGVLPENSNSITTAEIKNTFGDPSASITAIFSKLTYDKDEDINITWNNGGNISLEEDQPSGGFTHFSAYNLTAIPERGYKFDQWSGNDGNLSMLAHGINDANNTILIEGNIALSAVFVKNYYNINFGFHEGGYVTSDGNNTFSIDGSTNFLAKDIDGWKFTNWTGDIEYLAYGATSTSNSVSISNESLLLKDIYLNPNFEPISFAINLNTDGNGTFDYFLESGDTQYSINEASLFVQSNDQLAIEILESPAGWGIFSLGRSPSPSSLTNPPANNVDPLSNLIWFEPLSDLNITAIFKILEYNNSEILLSSGIGGTASLEIGDGESGHYKHFSTYDLNASLTTNGYTFREWIVSDNKEGNLQQGRFEPTNNLYIDGPISVEARFDLINYKLNLSTYPVEGGTVSGPATFTIIDSEENKITATDNKGWDFEKWTGDTEFLLNQNKTTYLQAGTNPKDLNITANFVREAYPISIMVAEGGTFDLRKNDQYVKFNLIDNNESVDSATRIGAVAKPDEGWEFERWKNLPVKATLDDSSALLEPLNDEFHFIPVKSVNGIEGVFNRKFYDLNLASSKGGDQIGSGTYSFEQLVEIKAIPQTHFSFKVWEGDTDNLIYDPTVEENTVSMPASDITLDAVFEPLIYEILTNHSSDGYFLK